MKKRPTVSSKPMLFLRDDVTNDWYYVQSNRTSPMYYVYLSRYINGIVGAVTNPPNNVHIYLSLCLDQNIRLLFDMG